MIIIKKNRASSSTVCAREKFPVTVTAQNKLFCGDGAVGPVGSSRYFAFVIRTHCTTKADNDDKPYRMIANKNNVVVDSHVFVVAVKQFVRSRPVKFCCVFVV